MPKHLFALGSERRQTTPCEVHICAAQRFEINHFTGHGLDHFRSREEHIGRFFNHDDQIGQSRRVGCASGAGSKDDADLGNDTGIKGISLEDLGITTQAVDPFLDACAA